MVLVAAVAKSYEVFGSQNPADEEAEYIERHFGLVLLGLFRVAHGEHHRCRELAVRHSNLHHQLTGFVESESEL